MKKHSTSYIFVVAALFLIRAFGPANAEEPAPIKIGLATVLTGESSAYGEDIKNALVLGNELFFGGRYQFIIEDDHCDTTKAVSIAHKLVDIDKVKYVLGIGCNSSLLATAPIYERAGVTVITSSATSGDKKEIGHNIFRLFPADQGGAMVLFDYIAKHHKRLGILTEENEYPVLMERTFETENKKRPQQLEIVSEQYLPSATDFKALFIKLRGKNVDAIVLNSNSEAGFINLVQQAHQLNITVPLYSVYFPASQITLDTLGKLQEGFIFSNVPLPDSHLTVQGKTFMDTFIKRFGPPKSIGVIAPLSVDSLSLVDQALKQKDPVSEYLHRVKFSGLLGQLAFDEHGAVEGFSFELQKIEHGKVEKLTYQNFPVR